MTLLEDKNVINTRSLAYINHFSHEKTYRIRFSHNISIEKLKNLKTHLKKFYRLAFE